MDYSDESSESSVDSETEYLNECCKQFSDENGNVYLCNVCNVRINKNRFSISNHIRTQQHENGVENLLESHQIVHRSSYIYFCEMCNSYTDDFMAHINTNIDHINWRWIYGGVDKDKLKFYIYEEHYKGQEADKYRSIYETMLVRNCVRKYNNETFFCEACNLRLTRVSEIYHIFGRRHTEGLEDYQSKRKV